MRNNILTISVLIIFIAGLSLTVTAQSFTGHFIMKITSYSDGSPQKTKMKCHVGEKQIAMEYLKVPGQQRNMKDMRLIIKPNEEVMYTLMERGESKMAFESEYDPEELQEMAEEKEEDVTVTEETKTIEGYTCKKVIITKEEEKTISWVTDEAKFKNRRLFTYQQAGPMQQGGSNSNHSSSLEGWTLQSTTTDKSSGEKISAYKITNIKEGAVNKEIFEMDDYRVMEMPLQEMFGN